MHLKNPNIVNKLGGILLIDKNKNPVYLDESAGQLFKDVMGGKYGAVAPFTPPSEAEVLEQLAAAARAQRDSLLASTDWTQLPDVPQATREAYAVYRQALRDVPQQDGFPTDIIWPTL